MRSQRSHSTQRPRAVRVTLLAVTALTLGLGCRTAPTETDPFLRGIISAITASEVRIAQSSGCGAIAGISDETDIEGADGNPVPFSALRVGDWVAVWHTDRVLDSCPPRFSARRIRVLQ